MVFNEVLLQRLDIFKSRYTTFIPGILKERLVP